MRRALLLLVVLPLAGCSAPAADEADTHAGSKTLPGHGSLEVNLEMAEGAEVAWEFQASRVVQWDVHTHDGERVDILDNGTNAKASGVFTAPRAGAYSLYVQNPYPTPVNVTYTLRGQFTLPAS